MKIIIIIDMVWSGSGVGDSNQSGSSEAKQSNSGSTQFLIKYPHFDFRVS